MSVVPEINKPGGKLCQHWDGGCKVYADRPTSCRLFFCGWLRGELPEWAKPSKIHMMIERMSDHFVFAVPEPGYEKTWRTKEVDDLLTRTYRDKGTAVVSLLDGFALVPDGHSIDEVTSAFRFFVQRHADQLARHDSRRLHD